MRYLPYSGVSPAEQQQLGDTAVPLALSECETLLDNADPLPNDMEPLTDFHPPAVPAEWVLDEQVRGWVCHYHDVHLFVLEHQQRYFAWVREDHFSTVQALREKENAA